MKFVILGFDGPDGQAKRKIHRPAHIEMIERHGLQGRIVLAGPLTDQVGSLIVIEVRSREEAEEICETRPIYRNTVYHTAYRVRSFRASRDTSIPSSLPY